MFGSVALPESFVTLTQQVLFEPEEPACDVCGTKVDLADEDDTLGSGLYIWSRGGNVVYDEPPLCASCGTAISLRALARWEIEEEEG
jgi:hypothetical protein